MSESEILLGLGAEPVTSQEVDGEPGPWHGWQLPGDARPYGWSREPGLAGMAFNAWVEKVGWRALLALALTRKDAP